MYSGGVFDLFGYVVNVDVEEEFCFKMVEFKYGCLVMVGMLIIFIEVAVGYGVFS